MSRTSRNPVAQGQRCGRPRVLVPSFLIGFLALFAVGCEQQGPNEERVDAPVLFLDPGELVPDEVLQDVAPRVPLLDGRRDGGDGGTAGSAGVGVLPAGGIIEPKGTLDAFNACTTATCSCQTVTLARVEILDYVRTEGFGIISPQTLVYNRARIYEPGAPTNPPETGPLRIPARDYLDSVCFYFSYPPCFAYWARQGRDHPCLAKVEISYPHFAPGAANFVSTYQLYSVRGVADFASGTKNAVCLRVNLASRVIPAGPGRIRWSVDNRECQPGVAFTFF